MPPTPTPTPTESEYKIFHDPANNILLCSVGDNVTFPFRKLHLESASEDFEGMLDGGHEGPRKRQGSSPTSALEVVDLAEDSAVLEDHLVFLHPRTGEPDLESNEELEQLVNVADKYATRTALHAILAQGGRFLRRHALALFALAIIREPPMLAALALRAFGSSEGDNRPGFVITDIPVELWARLPAHVTIYLCMRQMEILDTACDRTSFKYDAKDSEDMRRKNPADFADDKVSMLNVVKEYQD